MYKIVIVLSLSAPRKLQVTWILINRGIIERDVLHSHQRIIWQLKRMLLNFWQLTQRDFQCVLLSEKIHGGLCKWWFHIYKVASLCAFVCVQVGVDNVGCVGWVGARVREGEERRGTHTYTHAHKTTFWRSGSVFKKKVIHALPSCMCSCSWA